MTWAKFKAFVEAQLKAKVSEDVDIENLLIWYIDVSYPTEKILDIAVTGDGSIQISC